MKKILVIIMAICMIATVLCVPAFAALLTELDAAPVGTVLRLSALKKNGTPVVIKDYDNFEDGWEAAVDYAEDTETMKTNGYDRVVVDFYADWIANEDGEFGNGGDGFEWSTIHITEDIRITLNLNNHTINRNLKEWEYDGEVIYIDENADVIINDGTISGGWSCNGAGGIHICEKARVVLNNVNIVGNNVDDDDGAGIAVYKGAILTMNGGSFQNNVTDGVDAGAVQGAAAYVEKGTATFNNVLFKNNQSFITYAEGTAIYATKATVTVSNCTFEENGIANTEKGFVRPITLISADASSMTIKASTFKGNGCYQTFNAEDSNFVIEGCQITGNKVSELFTMQDSLGNIKDVTITGNTSHSIFHVVDTELDVTGATITDNVGQTLYIYNCDDEIVTMTNCILGNNTQPSETTPDVYIIEENTIVFVDSTLGDTTFNDEDLVKVIYSGVAKEDAAISVTKLFKDGTIETVYYRFFEYGWNFAIEAALTHDYERIIVDLYDDWNAVDGQFTDEFSNGAGFDNDTIYIPAKVQVTLNLNGHTINRGLTEDEDDGEVIFINDDADVIINDGTIKGGFSNSEGGGLYIEGGANVTLNNVNIEENSVRGDDGAGIYLYGGATLTMNGGSVSRNFMDSKYIPFFDSIDPYGVVYVKDSTVVFNGVTFDGNYADTYADGLVIYAVGSTVKMNQCTVSNNATKGYATEEIIYAEDSSLTITDTDFINNNKCKVPDNVYGVGHRLLHLRDSDLSMAGGTISQNSGEELFHFYDSMADIKGVTITDNTAVVMYINNGNEVVNMAECTLGNNTPKGTLKAIRIANEGTLTMVDCILGDTTFNKPEYIKFTTSEVSREEAVIGIDLLRADGTSITQKYYKDFASGWNFALECLETLAYDRLVVDLYADVNTKEYGVITVPERARVTLNMNGHTIDRGEIHSDWDGEVIYVGPNADVVINDGTITGGCSSNGAGGIHIKDNARVYLNDVNVVKNASDGSNGAGIAVYNGAVLIMNGGSLSENTLADGSVPGLGMIPVYPYGTLYVEDATATLSNVVINENRAEHGEAEGVAIYAEYSTVTLNDCVVSNNGTKANGTYAESIIGGDSSTININNTDFIGNGSISDTDDIDYSHLFYLYSGRLTINGGKITGNAADKLFYFEQGGADLNGVTITDNASVVLDIDNVFDRVTLTDCVLGNNSPVKYDVDIIVDTEGTLVLNNCDLGDTTFDDEDMVTGVGSVFGEGSLTMIVSLLSLVASGVAIFLIADTKKKLVSATAYYTAKTEEEE